MRYIVIDPVDSRITETQNEAVTIGLHLMKQTIECEWVQRLPLCEGVDIWIDEEGLLNANRETAFFLVGEGPSILAGKGLICGVNRSGDSITLPDDCTLDFITRNILFLGGLDDVIQGIQSGRLQRPASYLHSDGRKQKIWEWRPEELVA